MKSVVRWTFWLIVLLCVALLVSGLKISRRLYTKEKNMLRTLSFDGEQKRREALNALMTTGVCVGCDLGWVPGDENRDLRPVIQAALDKGLAINLANTNLTVLDLSGLNLSGAQLQGANLQTVDLVGADLTGANLTGVYAQSTRLMGANLTRANLHGALLEHAFLDGVNLTEADLTDAIIYSDLTATKLDGADLRGAVIAVDLTGVDVTNAKLDGTLKRLFLRVSYQIARFYIEIEKMVSGWWNKQSASVKN